MRPADNKRNASVLSAVPRRRAHPPYLFSVMLRYNHNLHYNLHRCAYGGVKKNLHVKGDAGEIYQAG